MPIPLTRRWDCTGTYSSDCEMPAWLIVLIVGAIVVKIIILVVVCMFIRRCRARREAPAPPYRGTGYKQGQGYGANQPPAYFEMDRPAGADVKSGAVGMDGGYTSGDVGAGHTDGGNTGGGHGHS